MPSPMGVVVRRIVNEIKRDETLRPNRPKLKKKLAYYCRTFAYHRNDCEGA